MMRTAKEIMPEWHRIKRLCSSTRRSIEIAITIAQKEAIEAAAEKTKGASMLSENEIKTSILSLINELI